MLLTLRALSPAAAVRGNPDRAGAGATDYMHLFGLVALGYMWCRIAEAAKAKAAAGGNGTPERMDEKLVTGRFFMERKLLASAMHLARIKAGAASTIALPAGVSQRQCHLS